MMKKPIALLLSFLLMIYVVIGFLTLKTLNSQAQTAAFNQRQQAENEARQISRFITDQLTTVHVQLSAITQFLNIEASDDLQRLVERTPIIQSVFILDNHHLRYPTGLDNVGLEDVIINQDEQRLMSLISPFIDDPSRLLQHATGSEGKRDNFGWYNALLQHQPALIYWQKKDDLVVGYVLSYATFRAQLIANADNVGVAGQYQLFDNGKLLLSNQKQDTPEPDSHTAMSANLSLPYPLQHWSLNYTAAPVSVNPMPMILSALALAAVISIIAVLIYRQTQRRIRLAAKQVQFVGQVSHELKTPLTNIRLYAELLSESVSLEHHETRYLQVITEETQRLTRLIQNVLNFSKSPSPHVETVIIDDLLKHLAQTFTPTLAHKNLRIRLDNQCPPSATINSDKDMLLQILGNFLSNAEKYASDGEFVDISAVMSDNHCTLSVRDYGQGMSKSELKHIFKPFYRVHNHLTEGVAGTGIGLTIAKQLSERINARIDVRSCTPGLQFSLVIPIHQQTTYTGVSEQP